MSAFEKLSHPPNHIYYAKRRHFRALEDVYDLSPYVETADEKKRFYREMKKIVKRVKPTPVYVIERHHWWRSNRRVVYAWVEGTQVAQFTCSSFHGQHRIFFPNGSSHSSHDVTLRWPFGRSLASTFTLESVPYFWGTGKYLTTMTLYRPSGGKGLDDKDMVNEKRYDEVCGMWLRGGNRAVIVMIDPTKIDPLVGLCTAWMLNKQVRDRQNAGTAGGPGALPSLGGAAGACA
ncbi:MAG: hypothetical protein M1816_006890 [Peltula sp. TS41687]|nr:MAG: hypothetical protein M1816_006890 [Peltula sp. TS41687]